MRTFIALEISPEIQAALEQAISHLKYAGADVKWVRPGAVHLTLKFLGEITEAKASEVGAALDRIAGASARFELAIGRIGAFPKVEYPRVIWVGLDKGAGESIALAGSVDAEMSRLGFDAESRPFAPHLTIGRVRSSKNRDRLKEKISSFAMPAVGGCTVASIVLFKSTLTPQGSIYTKLHESDLRR
jgi:2'-5' RNA ligase